MTVNVRRRISLKSAHKDSGHSGCTICGFISSPIVDISNESCLFIESIFKTFLSKIGDAKTANDLSLIICELSEIISRLTGEQIQYLFHKGYHKDFVEAVFHNTAFRMSLIHAFTKYCQSESEKRTVISSNAKFIRLFLCLSNIFTAKAANILAEERSEAVAYCELIKQQFSQLIVESNIAVPMQRVFFYVLEVFYDRDTQSKVDFNTYEKNHDRKMCYPNDCLDYLKMSDQLIKIILLVSSEGLIISEVFKTVEENEEHNTNLKLVLQHVHGVARHVQVRLNSPIQFWDESIETSSKGALAKIAKNIRHKNEEVLSLTLLHACEDFPVDEEISFSDQLLRKIHNSKQVREQLFKIAQSNLSAFLDIDNSAIISREWSNKVYLTTVKLIAVLESISFANDDLWKIRVGVREYWMWIHEVSEIINQKRSLQSLEDKNVSESMSLIITEGKTDEVILTAAWDKLYPQERMPFRIVSSALKRGGGDGGAGVLSTVLDATTSNQNAKIIGIYDRDNEGINQFHGRASSHWNDVDDALKSAHDSKTYAVLLPVPKGREVHETEKILCIEYYFTDEILQKFFPGSKKEARIMRDKNGIQIRDENGSPVVQDIVLISNNSNAKTNFANSIVPKLRQQDFANFKVLFDRIKMI
ncbi:MAG: hypothetical protein PHU04_05225 [Candidatus Peribacteraceae bacterium]|nr:hypothetical protein [Candidatus Peribacteraceae bacterium]